MARTITRWNPSADLAEMRTRFDRLLTDLMDGEREWMPAIDVVRGDEKIVVRVDLPGIKPEETEIEVDRGVLTISGKHEETEAREEGQYVRRERRFGAFSRSMPLPDGVDAEAIEARCADGVLEVTVPLPDVAAAEPVKITPTAA